MDGVRTLTSTHVTNIDKADYVNINNEFIYVHDCQRRVFVYHIHFCMFYYDEQRFSQQTYINLLVPEFFLILAHPVYTM